MIYYQLRNELWKMFGKKRTYIGFGVFLLAHSTVLLIFRFWKGPRLDMTRRLNWMGFDPARYISNLTMATLVLILVGVTLMPLYVALVGGDLLAKEAEDGTLRMILARPISRFRLALVKWIAGVFFSVVLALAAGVLGLAVASCLFPSGGLFVLLPWEGGFSVLEPAAGWVRYVAATFAMSVYAVSVMGLALMFSCFNIKPAAATILALSVLLTCRIVQELPYFHDLQPWFITYHMNFWMHIFDQPVSWGVILQSLSVLLGFNLTLLIIGCVAFQVRDIKS
jgi:ABC-2 type transport system permease protein